jgi:hypothetical protein
MDLVTPLLPEQEVSIMAGAPGAGKTRWLMQMIASLQRGEPVFGLPARKGLRLAYIAADRSWASYEHWAHLAGVDLASLPIRKLTDDTSINLKLLVQNPMSFLEEGLLKPLLPADLIVVDPLIIFLGGNIRDYTANAVKLIRLNRYCKANQVTLLGTHHAGKARTDYGFKRPQDRISGTAAFLGYSSTQIFLNTPEESGNPFHELHVISHTAPPLILTFDVAKNGLFTPSFIEEPSASVLLGESERKALLLSAIPQDAAICKHTLVAVCAGIPERSLERYLLDLIKDGLVVRLKQGAYQRVPIAFS